MYGRPVTVPAGALFAITEYFRHVPSGTVLSRMVASSKPISADLIVPTIEKHDACHLGAFPLDPYSHTPGFGGASQPGMTGQVKEEILARWLELGVRVENGRLVFDPLRVDESEFMAVPGTLATVDAGGAEQTFALEAGQLAFTFCQFPVVYAPGDAPSIVVHGTDDRDESVPGNTLPAPVSAHLFGRTGRIRRVTVRFRR